MTQWVSKVYRIHCSICWSSFTTCRSRRHQSWRYGLLLINAWTILTCLQTMDKMPLLEYRGQMYRWGKACPKESTPKSKLEMAVKIAETILELKFYHSFQTCKEMTSHRSRARLPTC